MKVRSKTLSSLWQKSFSLFFGGVGRPPRPSDPSNWRHCGFVQKDEVRCGADEADKRVNYRCSEARDVQVNFASRRPCSNKSDGRSDIVSVRLGGACIVSADADCGEPVTKGQSERTPSSDDPAGHPVSAAGDGTTTPFIRRHGRPGSQSRWMHIAEPTHAWRSPSPVVGGVTCRESFQSPQPLSFFRLCIHNIVFIFHLLHKAYTVKISIARIENQGSKKKPRLRPRSLLLYYISLFIKQYDSKAKKEKKNSRHAATTLHNIVYRTITAINKLITITYTNFIASHVGHIEFLI